MLNFKMPAVNSVSDELEFCQRSYLNKLRSINTGMCITPTKQSKPTYSHVKHFRSENGNITKVIDVSSTITHSSTNLSQAGSLNSSLEDATELNNLIKFHSVVDKEENCGPISLSSSSSVDKYSHISFVTPKTSSPQSVSEEGSEYSSDDNIKSDVKNSTEDASDNEIRQSIVETPKRTILKTLNKGRKFRRKPIRLANLPRKIHTRDKDEIRIVKEDIKITEVNSNAETFDINKYLAKTRRKLTFSMEDSDDKVSSSSISSKLPEGSKVTNSLNEGGRLKKQTETEDKAPSSIITTKLQKGSKFTKVLSEGRRLKKKTEIKDKAPSYYTSTKLQEGSKVTKAVNKGSGLKKQRETKEKDYSKELSKLLEETEGKFPMEDYLYKIKGISVKPPTTRRAKMFEQRSKPKTYFDFDDYCKKLLILKEKFDEK